MALDPFFGRCNPNPHHAGPGSPHGGGGSGSHVGGGVGGGGFGGALAEWSDIIVPRGAASFNVWELSPNKLRTAAVAFTFCVTAGYISMLAAAGLLAILATGAVVTFCVMLVVLVCATFITLIVTGVPIGYAVWRLVAAYYGRGSAHQPHAHGGGGGGGGGGGMWGNVMEEDDY